MSGKDSKMGGSPSKSARKSKGGDKIDQHKGNFKPERY